MPCLRRRAPGRPAVGGGDGRLTTQLRDYQIAAGHLAEFVDAWRIGVLPLRRRHGFRVDGAWVVAGDDRFIWLLTWPGPREEFEARDRAYYASAERAALRPDPAQWIVATRLEWLTPILD